MKLCYCILAFAMLRSKISERSSQANVKKEKLRETWNMLIQLYKSGVSHALIARSSGQTNMKKNQHSRSWLTKWDRKIMGKKKKQKGELRL